jgi:apolipoprotein D and lipocalin family protein
MALDVKAAAPLEAVSSVDLNRYAGTWYEIARLPNRFQRDCESDISARYTIRPDGKISVVNTCRTAGGRVKTAKGTAHLASRKGPSSKLRVTFFWPFYGDYWIIDLDPEYQWAVVGEPGRKYLWILAREPRMSEPIYLEILERIRTKGYDLQGIIRAKHANRSL